MDVQLKLPMKLILTLFEIAAAILVLLHTPKFSVGLLLAVCAYVAIVMTRDYIMKVNLSHKIGGLFFIVQTLLTLVLCVWSESYLAQIYLLILIGEFAFHHNKWHALIYTTVCYLSILAGVLFYRNYTNLAGEIYLLLPRVIDYYAIFGMCLLARVAVQQKNQLARDNEQLQIASIELERKAQLQERTRISREIHDSVGHTLTAALSGLQTAAYAIEKSNYPLVQEMIDRTREKVLGGLNDVRSSVHLLRENIPDHPFIPRLIGLIEETKKHTCVEIDCQIDTELPELSPLVEITIFRALQEGLTNGIRHGSSTSFLFSLTFQAGHIRFMLSDNGKTPHHIVYGFGLNAMKERVEEVDGKLSISHKDTADGVKLEISIPFPTNTIERSE